MLVTRAPIDDTRKELRHRPGGPLYQLDRRSAEPNERSWDDCIQKVDDDYANLNDNTNHWHCHA